MATTYPTTKQTMVDVVDNTTTVVASHHNNNADTIEALEDKVGMDSSAVATSHDYKLTHLPAQATDFDAGAVQVRGLTLQADCTTGTIPIVVTSTTMCTNLNANMVNGKSAPTGTIVGTSDSQTLTYKTLSTGCVVPGNYLSDLGNIGAGAGTIPDANLPAFGKVVQIVTTSYTTYASLGTTAIVLDDSKPTWAEGNEIAGLATTITPTSATNILEITGIAQLSANTSGTRLQIISLFQDPSGTDTCKDISSILADSASSPVSIPFHYTMVAGTTSATTFKFRTGNTEGYNTVINGKAASTAGRVFGGALVSLVVIKEIKV